MKISYAITVCNELIEIQRLLSFLIKNKRKQDEIVVFYDTNNGTQEVEDYLKSLKDIRKIWIYYCLSRWNYKQKNRKFVYLE
jgi:hypothetical protein